MRTRGRESIWESNVGPVRSPNTIISCCRGKLLSCLSLLGNVEFEVFIEGRGESSCQGRLKKMFIPSDVSYYPTRKTYHRGDGLRLEKYLDLVDRASVWSGYLRLAGWFAKKVLRETANRPRDEYVNR